MLEILESTVAWASKSCVFLSTFAVGSGSNVGMIILNKVEKRDKCFNSVVFIVFSVNRYFLKNKVRATVMGRIFQDFVY